MSDESAREDKRVDFEFESADEKRKWNIWRVHAGLKWKDWLPDAIVLYAFHTGLFSSKELGMTEAKRIAIANKLKSTKLRAEGFIFTQELLRDSLNPVFRLISTPKELDKLLELSEANAVAIRKIKASAK